MAKPLFKWTGGKGRLFQKYQDVNFFPDSEEFDVFVDLFFGAGAVSCWVHNMYPDKKLIINDINLEMVNVYNQIKLNWHNFRDAYTEVVNRMLDTPVDQRKEKWLEMKWRYCWDYKEVTDVALAAMLLFMLKTNFNGIWVSHYKKWNLRFGTPPGHMNFKERNFTIEELERFKDMLDRATIYSLPFDCVPIPERAWVYADPPYRDTGKMYSDQFDDTLQTKLAFHLQNFDCLYAESNKEIGDGFWEEHFPEAHIHYLDHKYTCGHGDAVTPVTEVLVKNYGKIQEPITIESFL
mgnify:CR=1 FL=1